MRFCKEGGCKGGELEGELLVLKRYIFQEKEIRHQWFWLKSVYLNMVLGAEEFFFFLTDEFLNRHTQKKRVTSVSYSDCC